MAPGKKTSIEEAERTGAAIPYNPRTDEGLGFFPLLFRAWIHSLVVAYAVFRAWPITYEVAYAEISEAVMNMSRIKLISMDAMTEQTRNQVRYIHEELGKIESDMNKELGSKAKDAMDDKYNDRLHLITNALLALAQHMDLETIGMTRAESDAGRNL